MDIKNFALERIIKWILGGDLFEFIRETVEGINDSSLSGSEKRDYVFKQAVEFAKDVSTVLLNVGIEIAVLLLKARLGELETK